MKTHESTKARKDKETLLSGKTSQTVLVSKYNGISLSKESFTLQALDTVSSNHSFASTIWNNSKLRRIFLDFQIAKCFPQLETKTKYMIQFPVAPYVQQQLIEDFTGQPCMFKFDKTTISESKKQYDGYVHCWSMIVDGSLMVTFDCGSLSKNIIVNRFALFRLSTSTILSIYYVLFHS